MDSGTTKPVWILGIKFHELMERWEPIRRQQYLTVKRGLCVNYNDASKKFKEYDIRFPKHDVMLAEIMFAQKRWNFKFTGLTKDYDWEIYYHQGKTNMVTDALSKNKEIKDAKFQNNWWENLMRYSWKLK